MCNKHILEKYRFNLSNMWFKIKNNIGMIMITIINLNYLLFIYFLTKQLTVQLTSKLEQQNEMQDIWKQTPNAEINKYVIKITNNKITNM
jgi:hypothetical protein